MNASDDRRHNGEYFNHVRREPSILESINVKPAKPKNPNPTLNAIAITALSKSQKPDKRDLLTPGMHHCTFTVFGTIDKEKHGARTSTAC